MARLDGALIDPPARDSAWACIRRLNGARPARSRGRTAVVFPSNGASGSASRELLSTAMRVRESIAGLRVRVAIDGEPYDDTARKLASAGCQLASLPYPSGTALQLLVLLIEALLDDPDVVLAVLPAGPTRAGGGPPNERLAQALEHAFSVVDRDLRSIVLLGATPTSRWDGEWIVPGAPDPASGLRRVGCFVDRADPAKAQRLREHGALCNTMIAVASGRALFELFVRDMPLVVRMLLHHAELPHESRPGYLGHALRGFPCVELSSRLFTGASSLLVAVVGAANGEARSHLGSSHLERLAAARVVGLGSPLNKRPRLRRNKAYALLHAHRHPSRRG